MERNERLVELLRKKYGIATLSQLNKALASQKKIDLSPFVSTDGLGINHK